MKRFLILPFLILGCASPPEPQETTAQEIIARNLDAVGGAEKIRGIRCMTIDGLTGSALLPPTEEVTLYLEKPDKMRQQGLFRIILCRDGKVFYNNAGQQNELTGDALDGLNYRVGFYHNAMSLLKWEDAFDTVQLEGKKRYGPSEQYVLRFPQAVNGHDMRAYIDAKTFLIDRLVYRIRQEGAGTVQVVNSLRDYKEFEGIKIPSRVVYDKVGWEEGPSQFVLNDVKVNPKLEESLFESAEIDFGVVTWEGNTVTGEIMGIMNGSLLTNITLEEVTGHGIEILSWMDLTVNDTQLKVKVLENIQTSASHIKPGEIYLCTYPFSRYPRLMLMAPSVDVSEKIPCKVGDHLILTPSERKP
jgi:hypothetical protein